MSRRVICYIDGFNLYHAIDAWEYARHRVYVRALQERKVTTHLGQFKKKPRRCGSCGATWVAHEEKETDVHLAARLVLDSAKDLFDRAVVITADSDLVPPIEICRAEWPDKEFFVAAPPKRWWRVRAVKAGLELTKGRLAKHLLPARLTDQTGAVVAKRPERYNPPRENRPGAN